MGGDTALVLANAVYFKGNWAKQFDPKATTDRPFHIDANTVKQVPTMFRKGNYKYADLADYDAKCIELPYAVMLLSQIFEKDLVIHSRYFTAFHHKCLFHNLSRISFYGFNFYYRRTKRSAW